MCLELGIFLGATLLLQHLAIRPSAKALLKLLQKPCNSRSGAPVTLKYGIKFLVRSEIG